MALPKRHADQRSSEPLGGSVDWRPRYEIENGPEVDAYVAKHPTVAAILCEAPDEIGDIFGEAEIPRLALAHDPENGDCWLSIKVPVEVADDTALALIYDLEDRWWLDRMQATDAAVAIDVVER
jgi:hypothetical protein